MKITLRNGTAIEGTESQIRDVVRALGIATEGLFYNSESRGLVLISEMDTNHLRNAILKMYREWLSSLYSISEPRELVKTIVNGNADLTFLSMLRELSHREEE